MIWGCIGTKGTHKLRVFKKGGINREIYRIQAIPLIQEAVHDIQSTSIFQQQVIVMQDNSSVYKAKATIQLFKDRRIQLMEWPAQSPNLNPIENLSKT